MANPPELNDRDFFEKRDLSVSIHDDQLYMPDLRYYAALKRQRARIADGLGSNAYNCDEIGNKETEASSGLCSREKEAWPDAEDHMWPQQFEEEGRVAPRYLVKGQHCPFDNESKGSLGEPMGCYHRCRIFQPAVKRMERKVLTKEEALALYDIRIAEFERRFPDVKTADGDRDIL